MLNLYQTKEGITGCVHRGVELQQKKIVLLSEAQAKLHNKDDEGNVTPLKGKPKDGKDFQFASDWEKYQEQNSTSNAKRES